MASSKGSYVLSYGGGVNSTALMVFLVRRRRKLNHVVFADTGGELPDTYDYLKVAKAYVESHGIQFTIVRSDNGSLYDTCVRRRVIPSQMWRWSTRDYKITPIYRFYRSLKIHIYQYVGIAYDEIDRMKDSRADFVTNLYPLVDEKLTREDCLDLIREEGLPLPVKSGCYFCPFNSRDRWRQIFKTHPDLFHNALKLEERSKHFPRQRLASPTLKELARSFRLHEEPRQVQESNPCGSECMT